MRRSGDRRRLRCDHRGEKGRVMVSARFFCGFDFFQHDAPLDASTMTRWLGPAGLKEMLKASVGIALDSGVAKPGSLERVSVDTTVQPKAIAGTRDIGRATLFLRRYAAPLTATCSFMRLPLSLLGPTPLSHSRLSISSNPVLPVGLVDRPSHASRPEKIASSSKPPLSSSGDLDVTVVGQLPPPPALCYHPEPCARGGTPRCTAQASGAGSRRPKRSFRATRQ